MSWLWDEVSVGYYTWPAGRGGDEMGVYWVVVLEKPTKKQAEEGSTLPKIVFGPKAVIAESEQNAAAGALIGEDVKVAKDRMEVIVRPF